LAPPREGSDGRARLTEVGRCIEYEYGLPMPIIAWAVPEEGFGRHTAESLVVGAGAVRQAGGS